LPLNTIPPSPAAAHHELPFKMVPDNSDLFNPKDFSGRVHRPNHLFKYSYVLWLFAIFAHPLFVWERRSILDKSTGSA
jgi:hypothetical protein